MLIAAGVRSAAGLLAVVGADTDNTCIVRGARALNPSICIVARGGHQASKARFRRVGDAEAERPSGRPFRVVGPRRPGLSRTPASPSE